MLNNIGGAGIVGIFVVACLVALYVGYHSGLIVFYVDRNK